MANQNISSSQSFRSAITTLAWCLSIIEGYQEKIEVIELNAIYLPSIKYMARPDSSGSIVLWR
jgi:hypothetical protein